jgi:hypothetical protein
MKSDTYIKFVLTVIAVCLVWISLGGPALITSVHAQPETQRVIVAGWESSGDKGRMTVNMPLPVVVMTPAKK